LVISLESAPRGKRQIVYGLLCARDGCPVAIEVFAGSARARARALRFTIAAGVCASVTARANAWHMLNVPSRLTDRTLPPNLGIGIQDVADAPDASAVDQSIEFSEPPNCSGHERGHLVPIRNVNADAIDPFVAPEF
jgi:hypothetical protein